MTDTTSQEQVTPVTNRKDIHQEITDKIIQQLEAGTVPWQQGWVNDNIANLALPRNAVTQNRYRGINILMLWGANIEKQYRSNEWASFKQWNSKNEAIRKGEKGNFIVYTDTFDKEVEGEIKKIPFLKYSIVFNRCQLASYTPIEITDKAEKDLVETIEDVTYFIQNTNADIKHHEGDAYYSPTKDKIFMPVTSSFVDTRNCTATENYYSTLFHELHHWTGHQSRLNRQKGKRFGDLNYANEELVAELGAAFLNAEFDITTPEKQDHAAYIANWLTALKNDKHFIVSAASEASKSVEFLRELQPLKLAI